jgi:hypothetical protein
VIRVVTWKWKPFAGYRSTFLAEHVNTLRNMVARHYNAPHEFVCITDDPSGIDADIRIVPLWDDFASLPSPLGARGPSCYRRLKAFSAEAAEIIGPRFVSLDLDTVIVGDVRPLFDRPEEFAIWGDTAPRTWYNGSFWLLTAGARTKVWTDFDPTRSPQLAKAAGQLGSDQAWLGYCLGPHEKKLSQREGIYSWRVHLEPRGGALPHNARMVMFHGHTDPWMPHVQKKHAWIRQHYR